MALQNEEHEQRKEIAMLRKLDQQENFMRSKNFHNLYKQKLAERILEKAARVNKSEHWHHREMFLALRLISNYLRF